MKDREREIESLPKSIYIAFPFPFSFFPRQESFDYAINLVSIVSSPKTKKIEQSIYLSSFSSLLVFFSSLSFSTNLHFQLRNQPSQHYIKTKNK